VETFEAPRVLRVHPGPVRARAGSAVVVLRALEVYPRGAAGEHVQVTAAGQVAQLAQGVPRVELALADGAGTAYEPLGQSSAGAGRTVFGTSFFAAAPPGGVESVEVTVSVSGTSGADVPIVVAVAFPIARAS